MLISIGQFSKICSVSVKTLRYYDEVDLLKPAKVDPLTGYRYYGKNQLNDMLTINRLKRYGFPLIEIKSFLSSKDREGLYLKLKEQVKLLEHHSHFLTHLINVGFRSGDIIAFYPYLAFRGSLQ